ncbi:MAG: hypothetical protein JXR83_01125 [Deltaproteobacteria bacterium]|nr:hypothetical protein [Deltaproteobacteria bacterium]
MALSLEQLARRADLVVRGTVRQSRSEWRGPLIYTVTAVEVAERLKGPSAPGPAGRTIEVAQLGGAVGRDAMPVAGAAELRPGEQVVLFLLRNRERTGEYYLAGMSQGKLGVAGDGAWLWAPTATLWDNGALREPTPRRVTRDALRAAVRGAR